MQRQQAVAGGNSNSLEETSTDTTMSVLVRCLVAVLLASQWGCRSAVDYQASALPMHLRAHQAASATMVDLSQVAQQTIQGDLVYPGDVLEVTIGTGIEETPLQSWPLRVMDDGNIDVPLVGPVPAAGLALTDIEAAIRRAGVAREIYRNPHVAVLIRQRHTLRVRVVGAVERPGVYELPSAGSDLLSALVAAGGLAEKAGTIVEIRHPSSRRTAGISQGGQISMASFRASAETPARAVRVDLRQVTSGQADFHVEDGSVVMVMPKPKQSVSVIGLVRKPNSYELPPDEPLRVLDALALAGGRTVSIADRVRVIRQVPDQEDPVIIGLSVRKAKRDGLENLVLAPGDTISVEETPATFVVETIRGFIRFGFTSAIPGL